MGRQSGLLPSSSSPFCFSLPPPLPHMRSVSERNSTARTHREGEGGRRGRWEMPELGVHINFVRVLRGLDDLHPWHENAATPCVF